MKEFVPLTEAKLLKKLGFDEPCLAKYQKLSEGANYQLQLLQKERNCNRLDTAISAPLYQQAFRWFRDKHNLIPNVSSIYKDETHSELEYWFWVANYEDEDEEEVFYGTYEEAELECLKKLI